MNCACRRSLHPLSAPSDGVEVLVDQAGVEPAMPCMPRNAPARWLAHRSPLIGPRGGSRTLVSGLSYRCPSVGRLATDMEWVRQESNLHLPCFKRALCQLSYRPERMVGAPDSNRFLLLHKQECRRYTSANTAFKYARRDSNPHEPVISQPSSRLDDARKVPGAGVEPARRKSARGSRPRMSAVSSPGQEHDARGGSRTLIRRSSGGGPPIGRHAQRDEQHLAAESRTPRPVDMPGPSPETTRCFEEQRSG